VWEPLVNYIMWLDQIIIEYSRRTYDYKTLVHRLCKRRLGTKSECPVQVLTLQSDVVLYFLPCISSVLHSIVSSIYKRSVVTL